MHYSLHTSQVPAALELWEQGDTSARARLVDYVATRLQHLAHAMLRTNPVRRWEHSDDLLQQALMRLHRSLEHACPPDARALLQLAALEMRHALIDLARHYFGPCGMGFNLRSISAQNAASDPLENSNRQGLGPEELFDRAESFERLYRAIGELPAEEREVVDLIWLHELSQSEAAAVLGIAVKTVGRRWRRARLQLYDSLREPPLQD